MSVFYAFVSLSVLFWAVVLAVCFGVKLCQELRRADYLENEFDRQERILSDQEMEIERLEIDNARLKTLVSILKMELEEKGGKKVK